ncbi:hypothetical protein [Leptolyngbya sp. 'hensonii']|uniref:hypothetical protein n=1 Tax=Leptolyngbya sp. 'hensonii' TaxID=1922337 RepID=UPI001C0CF50D|nr:hypothetical protein [Leptolyngbya sp. 'hensonii']
MLQVREIERCPCRRLTQVVVPQRGGHPGRAGARGREAEETVSPASSAGSFPRGDGVVAVGTISKLDEAEFIEDKHCRSKSVDLSVVLN